MMSAFNLNLRQPTGERQRAMAGYVSARSLALIVLRDDKR
jgi:hypothetical protein